MKESTALQILCRNKLENLKLKDFNNSTDLFNEFEKSVNELKEAGTNVPEKEKVNYMLRTLPDSMSHIRDLIDVLKEEEQNVEYVKNKIEMAELKEKNESENSRSNAFTFEKRREDKRTCYVCGSVGHIQYDCLKKNNSWNRGTPQRREGQSRAPQRGRTNYLNTMCKNHVLECLPNEIESDYFKCAIRVLKIKCTIFLLKIKEKLLLTALAECFLKEN